MQPIQIKTLKPIFTSVLVTMDRYTTDVEENGIITIHKDTIKEIQKVLAVGESVKAIKPGDYVAINFDHYAVKKFQDGSMNDGVTQVNKVIDYNLPVYEVGGVDRMLVDMRDILFVAEIEEARSFISKQVAPKIVVP